MKLVSLETWLRDTYGDDAPKISTARKWCRDGKLSPRPEKHGRSYFVDPATRYTDRPIGKPRLVERLNAEKQAAG